MDHQKIQRDLNEDLDRLRLLLRGALRESGVKASRAEEMRILDLACGSCNEAEVLADLLPRELAGGGPAPDATLVGIDIREREIADAAARCRAWLKNRRRTEGDPATRFEFLARDATKIGDHRELGDDFDVVFLRHQNFYDGDTTWRKIFAEGLEKLSADGVLVLTSYFDKEHRLALDAIRDLGGELILTRENADGRQLPTPGKVVDKHVAILRKKG